MTDWGSEELWRKSLTLQRGHLRSVKGAERASAENIAKAERRIERIWAAGLPEWQARVRESHPLGYLGV